MVLVEGKQIVEGKQMLMTYIHHSDHQLVTQLLRLAECVAVSVVHHVEAAVDVDADGLVKVVAAHSTLADLGKLALTQQKLVPQSFVLL